MMLTEALAHGEEVVVVRKVGALNVAIAPFLAKQHREVPTRLGETGGERSRHMVEAVVAYTVRGIASALAVRGLGHDVHRAANRRHRHLAGTQSALRLHVAHHLAQSAPVAPVESAVLHIVDGHAVHHHCHVRALETTHVQLRVAVCATVLRGIHTRSLVEHFGQLVVAELVLHFPTVYIAHCDRSLTRNATRSGHGDVLQHHTHLIISNGSTVARHLCFGLTFAICLHII